MNETSNVLKMVIRLFVLSMMLFGLVIVFYQGSPSQASAQTQDDTTAPTVSSVTVTSDTGDDEVYLDDDGVYGIGDKIEVTVTFSEDVTLTGSPQLELTIGSAARKAAYKSTTGSKVVFGYTVAVGDTDTDGISIAGNKLSLNGGSIRDAADNAAVLSHSALSAQTGHKVDGIRPTITSVYLIGGSSNQDGVYTSYESLLGGVNFSEHIYVVGRPGPRMKLNFEGTTRTAEFAWATPECKDPVCATSIGPSSRYGISLAFEYMIAKGELDLDGVAIDANSVVLNGGSIRDGAGNNAILTHSARSDNSYHIVDAVPATVKSVAITSDPGSDNTYGVGDTIEVTVTFSESVRVPRWVGSGGVVMPLLELNIGGVAKTARTHERSTITGTSVVFSYTVQDGDNDADGVSIGANKLTAQSNRGITDNYSGCCPGGERADLHHSAVADDEDHKVGSSMPASLSTDATLKGLTLSGIDFGTFTSDTESYSASVAYRLSRTSVIPTVNHSGARYVTKLGGVTDDDDMVSLVAGSNVITVVVTAEDGSTTKTYTVTVTRAAPPAPSTDATVKGLTLRGIDFGTFASDTASYSATVANDVSQTLVNAKLNHPGASYITGIGGLIVPPGGLWTKVFLATGVNVITIEAIAEDRRTRKIYTVTVTREAASTDATLKGLTLSGIDFGTFASDTASYTAEVTTTPTETTVTPTVNHSGAQYVIKLGGVEDEDGTISLAVGSNVITVEVTAEDRQTTKTYTLTVTRLVTSEANLASTDATLSDLTLSGVNFGTFASDTESYTAQVANSVTETTVTPTVNDDGANYVIKLGGVTDSDGTVSLAVGSNVITVEVTAEDDETTGTYTITVTRAAPPSADAALRALTLSGIDFGTFAAGTTSYTATVANSVSQTTVSPTVNDDGASYVIKLGGVTDSDGTVSLAVGSNVITVEVTAEDTTTTQKYSVTVTRAAPPSSDATLKALSLTGTSLGAFRSVTTSYSAQVANSVTEITVTPSVNHSGASYVIKLGGVNDADGTVSLAVGRNVITVEVTAEDGNTTQTYTVNVTRADPPSIDATLSALTLSDIDFGTFASDTTSYSADVGNDISQTTVTPIVNDSGASYVIKLDGVADPDGTLSLAVGSNVITVVVTAEDETTIETYTVTVTRSEPLSTDATLKSLSIDDVEWSRLSLEYITAFWVTFDSSVTQATVRAVVNHPGASYVLKVDGVVDDDGVVPVVRVSAPVKPSITIEVTAEDEETTRTYDLSPRRMNSTNATLSALTLSGIDYGTFSSGTTSYTATVAYSVTETTVMPTGNQPGTSYVIKLDGVSDADGTVFLSVGANVITVEVTAEDDRVTSTYTVTVTRAEPPSTDATLKALTLSRVNFGTFDSTTTSYSARVANSVRQTTVRPTVNDSSASYVIKLGDVTYSDGKVTLAVGSNVITIEVIAEDDSTTRTYTVTVTRAEPPSTDATLRALSLSGVDFGTFDSKTTSYRAQVANSVRQTTVSPTVNDSGASYVIKLGGVNDADGTVSLAVGSNVITVEVTAEDGETTKTYTVTVTRSAPPSTDAAPSPLTVSVESAPTSHNGSDSFRIRIAFSETPESGFSYTTMRDHAFTVTGGDVTGARRLVSGKNLRWEITVQPSGNADVTVELPATTNCAAQGAICTDNDDKLSNSLNLTVSGPEATPPPAVVVSALTASVESTPTSHNGSNSFRIRIALSEAPKSSFSYTTMRDHAFTVTGGDVTGARRLVSGKNLRWEITVQPSGNADVTVLLPATTNCAAQGAICTGNDDKLSNSLNLIVSGPN